MNGSFIRIQAAHDDAMLCRHERGGDTAQITINDDITVTGLVDNESDTEAFQLGGVDSHKSKLIHVFAAQMSKYVYGKDYRDGQGVSINGDQAWQIDRVVQSADLANMIDIYVKDRR